MDFVTNPVTSLHKQAHLGVYAWERVRTELQGQVRREICLQIYDMKLSAPVSTAPNCSLYPNFPWGLHILYWNVLSLIKTFYHKKKWGLHTNTLTHVTRNVFYILQIQKQIHNPASDLVNYLLFWSTFICFLLQRKPLSISLWQRPDFHFLQIRHISTQPRCSIIPHA